MVQLNAQVEPGMGRPSTYEQGHILIDPITKNSSSGTMQPALKPPSDSGQ